MTNLNLDTLSSNLSYLQQLLVDHFSLNELQTLCFDLEILYDDLGGEGVSAKARELLLHLQRSKRIETLLVRAEQLRPNVDWRIGLPAEPEAKSPYKGLQNFTEDDAALFFGRDQLTAVLLDHLRQHRFLAVVGASGSGKSSVVQAGVLPAMRGGAIAADSGSADWPIHLITPGDEPLKALAVTFTRDSESMTAAKTLQTDLQADGDILDLYLYRQLSDPPRRRLLLVVDQFEELFTQCDDPAERQLFVDNLVNAVTSGQQGRLSLILTLRADFYAFAVQFENLRPLLETRQKIIGAMSEEELRQAITGPAAQTDWQLQPGLVETMLQDVGREPGALPLLSHALQETWERREGRALTLAGYQAAGGVRKAIATTANAVYASLNESQQAIARNIFLRLTELGEGTEDTRRRAALPELLPQGENTAAVQDVLDLLARRRLVTLNEERSAGESAQNYAEVAHEALIREWPELRAWLDDNRQGLRIQRQITAQAQEWQAAGEDSGYLYRGGRLAQAQELAAEHGAQLNVLEHRFLAASQEAVEREDQEREAQRQRELAQAQQLAEEQKKARNRLRQIVGVLVGGLIMVGVLAVLLFNINQVAQQNARAAEARALAAEANQWLTEGRVNRGLINAYQAMRVTYDRDEAVATEVHAALISALDRIRISNTLAGHIDEVNLAAFHPAGTRIVTASEDGTSRLWDAEGNHLAVLEGHSAEVRSAAFNPAGTRIVTASGDGTARLWDEEGNPLTVLAGHSDRVLSAAFDPAGTRIVTASGDGTARLWDAEGNPLAVLEGHSEAVWSAAFNPAGTRIVTASGDGTARLWDAEGNPLAVLADHNEGMLLGVSSAVFNPEGTRIVTASGDGTARLWDAEGNPLAVLEGHSEGVWSAAFNPAGTRIVTTSEDGTARLWDEEGNPLAVLAGHSGLVLSAAFNPAGTRIVTASWDGTARLWDAQGNSLTVLEGHSGWVWSAVFNPAGTRIVTASKDGTARLWDAQGDSLAELAGHSAVVWSAAFNSAGTRIVTASGDGTARLWDAQGSPLAELAGHSDMVLSAAFNSAGTRIVTASTDGTARLWEAQGSPLAELAGHSDMVLSAAFNSAGTRIVTTSADGTARLWDAQGNSLTVLAGHSHVVLSAAFNPAGTRIVTTSADGTARLWDAEGNPLAVLEGHSAVVWSAVFNPAGTRIVTASGDGTARLWDAQGNPLTALAGHSDEVRSAAFNPAGTRIVTASEDGTARLWDAQGKPLAVLEGRSEEVWSAAFNSAATRIVTTSADGTARLWDAQGSLLTVLAGHTAGVNSAAFNPAGTRIVTASTDGTARLWRTYASYDEMLAEAERKLRLVLSPKECQQYFAEFDPTFCENWEE